MAENVIIAREMVFSPELNKDVLVSTIALALELFETRLFGEGHEYLDFSERYSTAIEALEGHLRIAAAVRAGKIWEKGDSGETFSTAV